MQMNSMAKRELQLLIDLNNFRHGRKPKNVSHATQHDRAHNLHKLFRMLHQNLNMCLMPRSFRMKHVWAIVRYWEKKGLSAATMQKQFSYLKTFCTWIGKAGMISGSLEDYLQNPEVARRIYRARTDKSWEGNGLDVEAIITEISEYDKFIGAILGLQRTTGIRMKEASMCRPHQSDLGALFHIKFGTKGGRERFVPIDTPEKRAAIYHAKSLVKDPDLFLGNPEKTLKQNISRYYTVLRKFKLTKAALGATGHGLRAGYGLNVYEQRTGVAAPVRGGHAIEKERDHAARLEIAAHYGHGRASISTAYLGGILRVRQEPSK